MNVAAAPGIEPTRPMIQRMFLRRLLAASAVFVVAGGGAAGCAIEDGVVGACVEDGAADACTQARAGRCGGNARFVLDESCETLGFTFACGNTAAARVGGAPARDQALADGATWVRSATTCAR